jgi:DNA-binding transcriptional ArsR family regulator
VNAAACDGRLEPPVALWIVLLCALEAKPEGVSVTQAWVDVAMLSNGRHSRKASVSKELATLRAAGLVTAREEETGRRLPAKLHTLSEDGKAFLRDTREQLARFVAPKKGR